MMLWRKGDFNMSLYRAEITMVSIVPLTSGNTTYCNKQYAEVFGNGYLDAENKARNLISSMRQGGYYEVSSLLIVDTGEVVEDNEAF